VQSVYELGNFLDVLELIQIADIFPLSKILNTMNQTVNQTLHALRYGTPQVLKNLAFVPLFLPDSLERGSYITLKEGIAKQLVKVTEISESGSVPTLMVLNEAEMPLLLMDGEELIGAKQNRIVNTSLLLPAKSKTPIPVSCTERGRWSYKSAFFDDSDVIMSSKARHAKSERLVRNLVHSGNYNAEQREVWNDIEEYHFVLNTNSDSRALRDAFEAYQYNIDHFTKYFQLYPEQVGVAAFLNGHFVGIDFVSLASAYETLHGKLVKSYAIEAIIDEKRGWANNDFAYNADQAAELLHKFTTLFVEAAEEKQFTPVGQGTDYRYFTPIAQASALENEGVVVHFSSYIRKQQDQRSERTQRFSF